MTKTNKLLATVFKEWEEVKEGWSGDINEYNIKAVDDALKALAAHLKVTKERAQAARQRQTFIDGRLDQADIERRRLPSPKPRGPQA